MSISAIGGSGYDATQMAADFFKKADTNSDGGIDKSEMKKMLQNGPDGKSMSDSDIDKLFTSVDTDGDGKISASENEAQMKKMAAQGGGGAPNGGGAPAGGGQGTGASGGTGSSSKTYDKKDLNKDGTVSVAEEAEYDAGHPEEATQTSLSTYTQNGNVSALSGQASNVLNISA